MSAAQQLFNRFRHSAKPEDCIKTAKEMAVHFTSRYARMAADNVGRAILDIMVPKKPVPKTFLGRPVDDFTQGRPDTPDWIFFEMIVDRDDSSYSEYFDAFSYFIRSGYDLKWTSNTLQKLKDTLPKWQENLKYKDDFDKLIRMLR